MPPNLESSSPDDAPVVVLGAGPAGLAAAWELVDRGVPVVIVERNGSVGGLCATAEHGGFRFDLGGHRILKRRSGLVRRLRTLLGDDLIERERQSVILWRNRRLRYPLAAWDIATQLPAGMSIRALRDLAVARTRRAVRTRPDVSFRDWTTARFGQTLYDSFFGPYTEKLWGVRDTELSADWASQRISSLNLADLWRGWRASRTPRTHSRMFLYPRLGIGQLFDQIATHVAANGAKMLLGATVHGFGERTPSGRVTRVDVTLADGMPLSLPCRAVISTIALQTLVQFLAPGEPEIASASARLRHRGLRFVNLALRGESWLGATWAYVADGDLATTRVQEPRRRSPEMAPPGCGSLMLEIPFSPGDRIAQMSDANLVEFGVGELRGLGIDLAGHVLASYTAAAQDAYPIYSLDYAAARARLLDAVGAPGNVWSVGRQGLFRYVFMDTAMEMGIAAASALANRSTPDHDALLTMDNNPSLQEVQDSHAD